MGWGGVGWGMLTFVWTCWACLNLFEAEIAFRLGLGEIHIYLENHQIQTSEFQSFCDRWIVFSPRRNDHFLKKTVFHDLTFRPAGMSMHACLCMHVYACMSMHACLCMHVYVCMSMYVYVCLCMSMYVCLCMCVYVCLCMSMYAIYVYVYVCLCLCLCMSMSMSMYVYVYVCLCMSMYVYVYMSMYVYVCTPYIQHLL